MAKSTIIALRDAQVIDDARRSVSRRDIAAKYGISEARVSQILNENLDRDEDFRAWLLEGYYGKLAKLQEIAEGKGRPITSGKGEHVVNEDTGEYAYDPSPVVDAIRTDAQIRKNMAQLMGNEKPPPKAVQEDPELIEYRNWAVEEVNRSREKDAVIASLQAQLDALRSQVRALENSAPADVVESLLVDAE